MALPRSGTSKAWKYIFKGGIELSKENKIKVVIAEVGKEARIETIPNTLEELQKHVNGWIECVRVAEGVDIVINEEGLLREDCEANFRIPGNVIMGTAVFVGVDASQGEFKSLTDEQAKYLTGYVADTIVW